MGDALLQHLVGGKPDGVAEALGFEELVHPGQCKRSITSEVVPARPIPVSSDNGLQHIAPFVGAVHVAVTKDATLQAPELVEQEQRVITGAAEVAVVRGTLLLTVGRADGAIHVEHDELRRIVVMNPVDPLARQISEGSEVLVDRQQLGLEPPHLAGRCSAALDRLAANDPAHRRIAAEPVGVVHVFVSGESSKDRLPKETDDAVPAVLASSPVGQDFSRQCG